MRAIAASLRDADAGPAYDIVCLQELWVYAEYRQFRDDVEGTFPYSRFFHTGALGSGLAVFSKFPILESQALPYHLSGLPSHPVDGDFFVNKAAARVVVNVPGIGECEVWDTHMHAAGESGPETRQAHRISQAWQLSSECRKAVRGGRYVFCMGDFNSQPFSVPIALMKNHGGLKDSFREAHPACDDAPPSGLSAEDALSVLGMTCDSPLNSWSAGKPIPASVLANGGKRLDYIFFAEPAGKPRLRVVRSEVVMTDLIDGATSMSDHFGLASTFALDNDSTAGGRHEAQELGRQAHPLAEVPYSDDEPAHITQEGHGAEAQSVRKALGVMRDYYPEAARRSKLFINVTVGCILLEIALAVGSAWQPKSWIQPIFTVLAFVFGLGGATSLYIGWLWGRWEKGLLDECMAEMENRLAALRG